MPPEETLLHLPAGAYFGRTAATLSTPTFEAWALALAQSS